MASDADVYVDEFGRTRKRPAGDASKKRERSYSGANADVAPFGDAPRGGLLGAAPVIGSGGAGPFAPGPGHGHGHGGHSGGGGQPPMAHHQGPPPGHHRYGGGGRPHEDRGGGRDRPRSRSRSRSRGPGGGGDRDNYGRQRGRRGEGGGGRVGDREGAGPRGGDRDRLAPVKEKERTVDAFDPHRTSSGVVQAEIPALATFPVWYDLRLQDGRLQATDPPSAVAQQYATFKQVYVADAASRFYSAHRHEEWFRCRYDPMTMLAARARRVATGRGQAQECLRAITSAAIGAVLPQLGGGYTGSRGLGLGLRQSYRRAAGGADPTAALAQAPVLLVRGVHASIGREELVRALSACSSLLALPKGPAKLTGTGGMLVPTLVPPSEEEVSRAAEAAVAEVSAMLWAEAEGGRGAAAGGEGGEDVAAAAAAGRRDAKRARAGSHPGTAGEGEAHATPGSSLSEDRKAEILAMAGVSLPALLERLRGAAAGGGLPMPVAVEMGDPKRLPGAAYRRNVWLEYDSLLDAAVARHLLRKVCIDVAGYLDPVASGKELARVRALAVGLGVPLSGLAEGEAAPAEGGPPLSELTLSTVGLNEAAGEVPSSALPRTVQLPAAEWHRPTYGGEGGGGGSGGVGGARGGHRSGGRGGGGRGSGRPGEDDRDAAREAAREGATLRGYPYGRPYTVDIPSWASTEEQVALDLPRALELAAVLDAELGLWEGQGEGSAAPGPDSSGRGEQQEGAGREEEEGALGGRGREEDMEEGRGRRDDEEEAPSTLITSSSSTTGPTPSAAPSSLLLPGAPPGLSAESRASALVRALYGPEGAALHAYTPLQQLDIALAYLRAVHCYDYYSGTQGSEAGDLRQAVGDGYRRQAAPGGYGQGGAGGGKAAGGGSAGAKAGAGAPGGANGAADSTAALSSTPAEGGAPGGGGEGGEGGVEAAGEGGEAAQLPLPHPAHEQEEDGPGGEEAGLGEIMYGQGKASEEPRAAGSGSKAAPAGPTNPGTGTGTGTGGYATFIGSERAKAAYETWARQHADRCRNRLLQARRQIAANRRGKAEEDESQSACVEGGAGHAGGGEGEDAERAAQPGRTKDGLLPVPGTGKGGESKPIVWASVKAAADRIQACKARLLAPLPLSLPDPDPAPGGLPIPSVHDYLHVLLAEWYTASTAPDTPEAASAEDGFPPLDPARLFPAMVLATARTCTDPAHENRTRCALCPRKIFKSPHFAMKHCLNKHPEEARAVFTNIVAMLHGALDMRLSEAAYMRRAYFSDTRRPMPWHDPADLKRLLTDTAAAAQRITGNGINLPLYLAALADAGGHGGGGGARRGGGSAVIAAALGLATGPAAAQAMSGPGALLTQLLSMALAGGIGPLGIGLPPLGGMVGAALGLPGLAVGGGGPLGRLGGAGMHMGQGMFNPGVGTYGGRGGGRGGSRGLGGRGGGMGGGEGRSYGPGEGGQQQQEGQQAGGHRGGNRRDSGGGPPSSSYRDKDAVRPAGPATAIDYGKAMVSYDDI